MCSFTALPQIRSGSRMVGSDRDSMHRRRQFEYQDGMWPSDPIMKTLDNASSKVEKRRHPFIVSVFSKESSVKVDICRMANEK